MSKLAITEADRRLERLMGEAPQGLEAAAHALAESGGVRGDRLTAAWDSYRHLRPQASAPSPPRPASTPPTPQRTLTPPLPPLVTEEDLKVCAQLGVSVGDFKRTRMKERLEALEGARDGRKAERELQA